jgi:hypothetical protein
MNKYFARTLPPYLKRGGSVGRIIEFETTANGCKLGIRAARKYRNELIQRRDAEFDMLLWSKRLRQQAWDMGMRHSRRTKFTGGGS